MPRRFIYDVGFTLFTQESVIERGMSHTTLCCEGTHLVIGQIARHIAERTAAAMDADNRSLADIKCIVETLLATMTQIYHDAQAVHLLNHLLAKTAHTIMGTDNRSLADIKCIVETLLATMTQIYHDAQAVHLLNHLLAKTAHTIMGIAAAGTIADIIITIMAERDINDATLGEMLHVTDINHLLAKTAHTIMGIAAAGTIADIIITIMAERDINDATLGEMLHVTDIVLQGETFLDAEHYHLSPIPLIAIKFGMISCYAEILPLLAH